MKKIAIIGSGLGGLVAGALLSKNGYRVTLLEHHHLVGGCATTYKRKGGYNCEVGLHEMDGLYQNDDKDKIFKMLDVYDNVEFVRVPEFYRVISDSIDFTLPDSLSESKEKLIVEFPHELEGIEQLYEAYDTMASSLAQLSQTKWYNFPLAILPLYRIIKNGRKTIGEFIDEIITDDRLKTILYANIGYYHDNPYELSYIYFMIAQSSYLTAGGWFIKGGSGRLSDYLASIITSHGGEIITNAEVTKVLVEDAKAYALEYVKQNQLHTLEYDMLISNASPFQLYNKLIGDEKYKDHSIEQKQVAISLVSIYIGFKVNLKSTYGTKPYSTMFMEGEKIEELLNQPIERRGFGFVDYSQIDSGLTPDDKSFGAIALNGYMSEWEELSDEAYQAQKQVILDYCLDRLEQEYPEIRNYIEFAEVATPKTVQRYIKTEGGTAYGFAPTPLNMMKRFSAKSKTLSNVRFVGAWAFGGGFSPAIMSGYQATKDLIKKG
jgi:phytoene dehydrogenase-like protein